MKVKIKRNSVCRDPARQTAWQIRVNNPIDEEQFQIIDGIIHSLRNAPDNYLIVDVNSAPLSCGPLTYVQAIRNGEALWEVELHFERPCCFAFVSQGTAKVRMHPWTQLGAQFHSVQDVSAVFEQILCRSSLPDQSRWRDYTKRIYLQQRKQER